MDCSSFISAIAALTSAVATVFIYRNSRKLYNLQKSIEDKNQPSVHIWCDHPSGLTFINLSKEVFALRELQILEGFNTPKSQKKLQFNIISMTKPPIVDDGYHSKTDLIIPPKKVFKIMIDDQPCQLTIKAINYSREFEFLNIDTSTRRHYILKGRNNLKHSP